jgi:tripartite-type tricarboxylate transporter receptor subunit TctC
MRFPRRQFLHLAAGAAALPAASRFAWAQAYPTRPVRIIASTAPGGAPDILARLMGQWLSERLGQQFVTENRPGGGQNIGTEAVVRAPADGYTLLLVTRRAANHGRSTQMRCTSRYLAPILQDGTIKRARRRLDRRSKTACRDRLHAWGGRTRTAESGHELSL